MRPSPLIVYSGRPAGYAIGMHSTETGNRAERLVAEELRRRGYGIHALNWRTPVCEIDIVASNNGCIYFVEVKYRAQARQGDGFDYVTPKKLQHMQRAANVWINRYGWKDEFVLMAAAVDVSGKIEFADIS
jgi:putative endonuclease